MAYLKIFPIKVTDKKALDYITNPDKTDEKLLVSSFGCSPETADLEFSMTREMAKKNGLDKMFFFSRLICKKNTDYKISVLLSSFTYIS